MSKMPDLVWISTMPPVSSPYSAGSAPSFCLTVSASLGSSVWPNTADTLGQDNAVDAVLQLVVLAADMELAVGILRHVGHLQNDRVEQRIVATGLTLNVLGGDGIGGSAQLGLNAIARR